MLRKDLISAKKKASYLSKKTFKIMKFLSRIDSLLSKKVWIASCMAYKLQGTALRQECCGQVHTVFFIIEKIKSKLSQLIMLYTLSYRTIKHKSSCYKDSVPKCHLTVEKSWWRNRPFVLSRISPSFPPILSKTKSMRKHSNIM